MIYFKDPLTHVEE